MKQNKLILIYLSILIWYQLFSQSKVELDTIYKVKHHSITTPFKIKECNDFIIQDKWLITYNQKTGTITVFDLNKEEIINVINLKKFSFIDLSSFRNLSIGRENQFWLFFEDYLIKMNINGNLLVSISLNEWYNKGLYPLIQTETPVIDKEQTIYLNIYPHSIPFNDASFYKSPLIYEYDIDKQELVATGIHYPDNYIKNYYGFHIFPLLSEGFDNNIITSFEVSNVVFMYNIKNKNISEKFIPNSFYKEKESLLRSYIDSSDLKLHHYIQGNNYEKILFDKTNKWIYFIYKMNAKTNLSYNTRENVYVIIITDQNFNHIKSIFVPENFGKFKYSFISDGTIYVQAYNNADEYLHLEKIELAKKISLCDKIKTKISSNILDIQSSIYPINYRIYNISNFNIAEEGVLDETKKFIDLSKTGRGFYCIEVSTKECYQYQKIYIDK